MTPPYPIVLSPYDLDARGLIADAAFLLGAPTLTLLPAPLEGMDARSVSAAAELAPEFQRFIGRWAWMQDLWRSAAIRPDFAGLHPAEFILETARELSETAPGSPLAELTSSAHFDSSHTYLRALCRDITRGGAQPSVSIPVSIGLSRFAHALDAPLLLPHSRRSGSVIQQLETRATRNRSGLTLTLPRDLEPESILTLRHQLQEPLTLLREAANDDSESDISTRAEQQWNDAIASVARELRIPHEAKRGRRLSTVRITIASMPIEATLAAANLASSLAARRKPAPRSSLHSPVALASRHLRVLSVRELPWQHHTS